MANGKKIYVIGHKNPDTDSIVSAIAYAWLKRELGIDNCFPARAGKINHQTDYILNRFGVQTPELISDLVPKVRNYMSHNPARVLLDTPLWHALEVLNSNNNMMLPIVDNENHYVSVLHYNAFAQNMLKKIDPMKKSIVPTSLRHLILALNAKPVILFNENDIFDSQICIGAYDSESFKEHISGLSAEGLIVTVGDREDIQKYVIEKGVHVLIVTGNKHVSDEVIELARSKHVSILISPYDTSVTSMLIFYSTPVKYMGDNSVKPVKCDEYIDSIRDIFMQSVSRSLPVIDDNGIVIGVISWGDLLKESDTEVIMVDHNEISQSIDGIDHCKILEIIDHHRLGNIHTAYPITFINRPVGSTSTIVASLYYDYRIPLTRSMAAILLAGILSDTIILKSATTTDTDRNMAKQLADISDLSVDDFGKEIMTAASLVVKMPAKDIINHDMKKYEEGKLSFAVSQIEVISMSEITDRKNDIMAELERIREAGNLFFSAILVTDITELNSVLFVTGSKNFISMIGYKKIDEGQFLLKGILSRKKQLMPMLLEILKKIR